MKNPQPAPIPADTKNAIISCLGAFMLAGKTTPFAEPFILELYPAASAAATSPWTQ